MSKDIVIYHRVYKHEGFDKTAQVLLDLVRNAQEAQPDADRHLYLDIDGHRNKAGGFDCDMLEIQKEFLLGFLMPYLTEVHMPLGGFRNAKDQINNNIPERLVIVPGSKVKGE